MPQSSLSILNMFKIYKNNFLHFSDFWSLGGPPYACRTKPGLARDMITCSKSVKIGLSGFKSVLIGIRLLLENPWNGEAAR